MTHHGAPLPDPEDFEVRIARTIREYWLAKGRVVVTRIERVSQDEIAQTSRRSDQYGVYRTVTDMVGGLPRRYGR